MEASKAVPRRVTCDTLLVGLVCRTAETCGIESHERVGSSKGRGQGARDGRQVTGKGESISIEGPGEEKHSLEQSTAQQPRR